MKTPTTPQQAINNFKLFLELSSRNSYADYRNAVRDLAQTCLDLGIEGDDKHPCPTASVLPAVVAALEELCTDSECYCIPERNMPCGFCKAKHALARDYILHKPKVRG